MKAMPSQDTVSLDLDEALRLCGQLIVRTKIEAKIKLDDLLCLISSGRRIVNPSARCRQQSTLFLTFPALM